MGNQEFKVLASDKGMRLDVYLHSKMPLKISRTGIQNIINTGYVTVNNIRVKPHYKIKEDDVIITNPPQVKEINILPESIPLDIVFEDDYLLVVNKPAGMIVHPAAGIYSGTLVNALLAHSRNLSTIGGKFKPGIIHRLDKDTSGLLVVAKSDCVHMELAKGFKEHKIFRKYIALVKGIVELDEAEIDVPIGRSLHDRLRMGVNFSAGRQSKTFYRVLKRYKNFTLIEVHPRTGRTHQIRVHMDYIGHPILGDLLYKSPSPLIGRHALHAVEIGFAHPARAEEMKFSSPLPADMQNLIPDYKYK